jgi:ribosomal-protein-alanine N-acetyltransferase
VLSFPGVVRLKGVENGSMIAFIAGDPRPQEGLAWIATIGVMPEYRHRGYGRALLAACEAQLQQPRVRLSVRTSNTDAIRLYEGAGYFRTDVWHAYYNDGGDALVMEKSR